MDQEPAIVIAASPSRTAAAASPKRGRKPRGRIHAAHLVGKKHLRVLQEHLAELRGHYAHPNRVLYLDDVLSVYLLAFFNPTLRSLRCIEDASELPAIAQYLHVESDLPPE